ncbi:SUN domain-containing protein [Metarhizium rileyi]|uniref:SUN domain-containing protein n=1 Tax=Metarhizium rileyi (strain RCEF 4871) TaxID=1649241 RepID=A0A167HAI3_METRR|nr:SUN domain-containing protein [Metarhizium rileyi RCEF 4871]
MRTPILQALGATAVLTAGCNALSQHRGMHEAHRRLAHPHGHVHSRAETNTLVKRSTCAFPTDDPNLVAVTPDQMNAGWAMSPDQKCEPNHYCPIACKSGMVMNQWDPSSTYTPGSSMNGGLFCDKNGNIEKPFPDKPNCVPTPPIVKVINKCKGEMSLCQTVLPGNEAMLIPTLVKSEAAIAVPDTSYWQNTGAHFYVNPPGTGTDGCIWGTEDKPIGNWSPYVVGTKTDANSNTFVTIGWNPKWQESTSFPKPGFGKKIECPNGGCVGLPCEIEPNAAKGSVKSDNVLVGAGGASSCTVTVSKGSIVHLVATDGSGDSHEAPVDGGSGSGSEKPKESSSSSKPPPPPPTIQQPTTSQTPTTTSTTPQPTTTSIEATTTPQPMPALLPTTSSTSTALSTQMSESTASSTSSSADPTVMPGIFHENGPSGNRTTSVASSPPSTADTKDSNATVASLPKTTQMRAEAGRQQGSAAVAGLVVALVAAAFLF